MLLAGTEGLIKNINTPAVHKNTKELDDSESSSVGSNLKNCVSMLKESQTLINLDNLRDFFNDESDGVSFQLFLINF